MNIHFFLNKLAGASSKVNGLLHIGRFGSLSSAISIHNNVDMPKRSTGMYGLLVASGHEQDHRR